MKNNILDSLHLTYISNKKGEKLSVVLPIDDFQNLIEEWEDMRDSILALERNNFIPIRSKEDLE